MGLKRGIFLGFLAGSAIAAALIKSKRAEAPEGASEQGAGEQDSPGFDLKRTIEAARRHAEEAIEAAHEAQEAREAELRQEFDQAKRRSKSP